MASPRINGLRSSGRFIRLHQQPGEGRGPESVYLWRRLAAQRVNIAFLSVDFLCSPRQITCLVAPGTQPPARNRPGAENKAGQKKGDDRAAGLISVFPHRFDPGVIGMVFHALGQEKLPWHCMASSGSMLSVVIDEAVEQQAVKAISRYSGLPADNGSTRQQEYDAVARRLKTAPETVAQYVEPRIRTYGIGVKTGLIVCEFEIEPAGQVLLGRALETMAETNTCFSYVCADRTVDAKIHVAMVLEPGETNIAPRDLAAQLSPPPCSGSVELRENAEKISFHGPHFGDRYGIADKALGCLEEAGVPVWLAGCVGATVTLIVPAGMGSSAASALSASFDNP